MFEFYKILFMMFEFDLIRSGFDYPIIQWGKWLRQFFVYHNLSSTFRILQKSILIQFDVEKKNTQFHFVTNCMHFSITNNNLVESF